MSGRIRRSRPRRPGPRHLSRPEDADAKNAGAVGAEYFTAHPEILATAVDPDGSLVAGVRVGQDAELLVTRRKDGRSRGGAGVVAPFDHRLPLRGFYRGRGQCYLGSERTDAAGRGREYLAPGSPVPCCRGLTSLLI